MDTYFGDESISGRHIW